ncbi:hypothetical protein EDB81DRAFT_469237 [Dactylonectria macrodidyma]|uniref:Uncharacterized protein n=1 Tax=Dactylonectria macrodidyma TaxID=307937 RepID=A0A9P9J3L6_9HYPO|nr:hypothetical protein EDB81DRAFT_469237 [Dactylonectria macrodidyma]
MATCARRRGRHDDAASNDERKQTSSRTGEWRTNKKRHILGALGILFDIDTILLCKTYGQKRWHWMHLRILFALPWTHAKVLGGATSVGGCVSGVLGRVRVSALPPLPTRCLARMWSEGTCFFFSWCPCFGFICNSGIDKESCILDAGTLTGLTRQARMRATACLDDGFALTRNPQPEGG